MSNRLNQEREAELQPKRIAYAKEQIEKLGYTVIFNDHTRLDFIFKGSKISVYPYSGWYSGKTVVDGRGIESLLQQIKP